MLYKYCIILLQCTVQKNIKFAAFQQTKQIYQYKTKIKN